jgi:hypothetical protein
VKSDFDQALYEKDKLEKEMEEISLQQSHDNFVHSKLQIAYQKIAQLENRIESLGDKLLFVEMRLERVVHENHGKGSS